jgi:hypothetical protein
MNPRERTVGGEPVARWVTAVEFRTSLGHPVDCQLPESHGVRGLPAVCEDPGHCPPDVRGGGTETDRIVGLAFGRYVVTASQSGAAEAGREAEAGQ